MGQPFLCQLLELPPNMMEVAAQTAWDVNPANRPPEEGIRQLLQNSAVALTGVALAPDAPLLQVEMQHLALVTSKWWGREGGVFRVGFLETVDPALRNKILNYANLWSSWSNVQFVYTPNSANAHIRLTLKPNPPIYASYVGTDNKLIPLNQPTMWLAGFSLGTPDSEYMRVVVHEFGHFLGFMHEHQRPEVVELLDPQKCYEQGKRQLGWSKADVDAQILTATPLRYLTATTRADQSSIMCYRFGGEWTRNGQPIPGGLQPSDSDKAFVGQVYPLVKPSPSGSGKLKVIMAADQQALRVEVA